MQQAVLFDITEASVRTKQQRPAKLSGAKDAISRYSNLREALDRDYLANGNWEELDTNVTLRGRGHYSFFDLFSGAGGISVGFRNAGFTKIGSVEMDAYASETIRMNFPESHHFEQPIETLREESILESLCGKKVDIVCGGPPCNGFSVAGLRKPNDARNQLFREYIRIVKLLKPAFIFMENVPGIVTMQNGEFYKEILQQFAEIGYPDMSVRILEAAEFGTPQLRTRAIFIGNRVGVKNPYPKPFFHRNNFRSIESAIDDLKNAPFDPSFNHHGTKHSGAMEKRLAAIPPGGSLYETFRDAWKRQYKGVPAMAIKENHGGVHVHYELDRVLTAREMARLQTFPDDFIFAGSFKKAYWQIGNAVPCLLAENIAKAIRLKMTSA